MFEHGFPPYWSTLKKLIWLVGTGVAGGVVWRTITGAIVSFIAKKVTPIEELKVAIEPVQSGSGVPSPDNVRPITGWTGCNIYKSGADTSNPTIYHISWQTEAGTVYGGTLDVLNGKLKTNRVKVTLTGEEEFSIVAAGGTSQRFTLAIPPNTGIVDSLVSHGNLSTSNIGVFGQFRVVSSGYFMALDSGHHFADLNEFKTWLAQQYSNGTPVEFVYGLTEETEYNLSGQEISTLQGENNIWADAGDVTVTAAGIKEITPSSAQALNMLLGGMYTNNHTADDVSDGEALDIILGGNKA